MEFKKFGTKQRLLSKILPGVLIAWSKEWVWMNKVQPLVSKKFLLPNQGNFQFAMLMARLQK